jgi:hypothetical protein
MRSAAAVAHKPGFERLEDRSLLSGYRGMAPGPGFESGPSWGSPFYGASPAFSGPMNGGAGAPRDAWGPGGDGFSQVQRSWSDQGSPPMDRPSWQPPGNPSTPEGGGGTPSGSEGNVGNASQHNGQSPSGPVSQASPGAAPDSGSGNDPSPPAAAAPNAPSASDTPGGSVEAPQIALTTDMERGANAPELGSEAAAVVGLPPVGPPPGPPQTPVAPGTGGARVALQAEASAGGPGSLMSAASVTSAESHAGEWVHVAWTVARRLSKPFVGDDAGALFFPNAADVIAGLVPFDRKSLERAIDRFVEQLDDAAGREVVGRSPARMILFTTLLAAGALALEVACRRTRGRSPAVRLQSRGHGIREVLPGFPELPGSWYSRLT